MVDKQAAADEQPWQHTRHAQAVYVLLWQLLANMQILTAGPARATFVVADLDWSG